jgi:hypothetical protein
MSDKVVLQNIYVKKGFGGKIELATRTATLVSIVKA